MPRPRVKRCIRFRPNVYYFKPQGIPLRLLDEVVLRHDELEALRLYDVEGNDQTKAAEMMEISQPTFARLLESAHTKVSRAIVGGMAVRIEENSENC